MQELFRLKTSKNIARIGSQQAFFRKNEIDFEPLIATNTLILVAESRQDGAIFISTPRYLAQLKISRTL